METSEFELRLVLTFLKSCYYSKQDFSFIYFTSIDPVIMKDQFPLYDSTCSIFVDIIFCDFLQLLLPTHKGTKKKKK